MYDYDEMTADYNQALLREFLEYDQASMADNAQQQSNLTGGEALLQDYDDAGKLNALLNMMVWLKIAELLRWYVVIVSLVSLPMYVLVFVKIARNKMRHNRQFLLALLTMDTFMLVTNTGQLLLGQYLHTEPNLPYSVVNLIATILCKNMVYISNTASMFTNWCWVLMWSWRYLSVFHPLRHLVADRRNSPARSWATVGALLVGCSVIESWYWLCTAAIITPPFDDKDRPLVQCGVDQNITQVASFRWVAAVETLVSFALPFVLTMGADVSILVKSYKMRDLFTTIVSSVPQQQLSEGGGGKRDSGAVVRKQTLAGVSDGSSQSSRQTRSLLDGARIVSMHKLEHEERRKNSAILRCVCAASIDLILNFPSYTLHLLDNFFESPNATWHYALEAGGFVLFYMQFLLTPLYVTWLITDKRRCSSATPGARSNADRVSTPSMAAGNHQFKLGDERSAAISRRENIPRPAHVSVQLEHSDTRVLRSSLVTTPTVVDTTVVHNLHTLSNSPHVAVDPQRPVKISQPSSAKSQPDVAPQRHSSATSSPTLPRKSLAEAVAGRRRTVVYETVRGRGVTFGLGRNNLKQQHSVNV